MLFKILHGDDSKLNDVPFHEGHCYVTHGGFLYVDLNIGTKESPSNQRVKLNANQAESLMGYSISQLINSTNSEIPTSQAVINELKNYALSQNVTSQVFDNGSYCVRFFNPGQGQDLDYYIHMGSEGELVHCVNNLCCLGIAAGTYEHNGVSITVEASTGKVKCSGAATSIGIFDLTNHDGIHLPRGKYYFSFGDNTIGFAEWDFGNDYIVNGANSFVMDIATFTTVYPRLNFKIASNGYTYDFLTIAPQISLITEDDEKPIYENWSLRTVYPKNSCHLLRNATKYGNNSILWTNYMSTILAYTASPKAVDDKTSKELITSQLINKQISFFNNDFDSNALECYVSVDTKSNNSIINCVNNLCCLGIAAGTYEYNGITMIVDSYTGKLTFSGTATVNGVRDLTTNKTGTSDRIPLKEGKYYCYFGSGLKEEYGLEWDFGNDYIVAGHRSFTIDLPSTGAELTPKFKYKAGQEYNFTIYPQVSLIEHDDEKPTYKNWSMRNIFYVNDNGMAIINLSTTDKNILWSLKGKIKSYTICPKIIQSTLNAANIYTNNQISGLELIKVVTTLPATGQKNKIYLVPKEDTQTQDIYDEYVWVNKGTTSSPNWSWEWITTKQIQIDLTSYLTKEEAEDIYSTKQELEEYKTYSSNNYASNYSLNETKNSLIGNIDDTSAVDSIMGAKKYADEKTDQLLNDLEDYAIEQLPTENLFDKNNYNLLSGYFDATKKYLSSSTGASSIYINIKPNYYYTINKIQSARFIVGVSDAEKIEHRTVFTDVIADNNSTNITIKAGPSSKSLAVFLYNSAYDTISLEEILNSLIIIRGKTLQLSHNNAIDVIARNTNDEIKNCLMAQPLNNKRITFFNNSIGGSNLDYCVIMESPGDLVNCPNNLCCLGLPAGTYEYNGINITIEASTGKVILSGTATTYSIYQLGDWVPLGPGKYYLSFGHHIPSDVKLQWDFGNTYIVDTSRDGYFWIENIIDFAYVRPQIEFIAGKNYSITILPQISLIKDDSERPPYFHWAQRTVYPRGSYHFLKDYHPNKNILWSSMKIEYSSNSGSLVALPNGTINSYIIQPKMINDRLNTLEDKVDNIDNWADVQKIVRQGRAGRYFSIGDQLVTNKLNTQLIWDIIGIDQDIPVDSTKTHSLTLQLHNCLSSKVVFDATEPDNPNSWPYSYGSNIWKESAVRQWLNSDKNAGQWWSAQTEYDVAPSNHSQIAGFLQGIDSEFLNVIGEVKKTTQISTQQSSTIDETNEKFFLPSATEVNVETDTLEGSVYSYYAVSENLALSRIKYVNGNAVPWYLRSPNNAGSIYQIKDNGVMGATLPYVKIAYISPCCCIV